MHIVLGAVVGVLAAAAAVNVCELCECEDGNALCSNGHFDEPIEIPSNVCCLEFANSTSIHIQNDMFQPHASETNLEIRIRGNVTHIERRGFHGLKRLRSLEFFEESTVWNMPAEAFVDLSGLAHLRILALNVRHLHPWTFASLSSLEHLQLQRGKLDALDLERIPPTLFDSLTRVRAISLAHFRRMTTVPFNSIPHSATEVYIGSLANTGSSILRPGFWDTLNATCTVLSFNTMSLTRLPQLQSERVRHLKDFRYAANDISRVPFDYFDRMSQLRITDVYPYPVGSFCTYDGSQWSCECADETLAGRNYCETPCPSPWINFPHLNISCNDDPAYLAINATVPGSVCTAKCTSGFQRGRSEMQCNEGLQWEHPPVCLAQAPINLCDNAYSSICTCREENTKIYCRFDDTFNLFQPYTFPKETRNLQLNFLEVSGDHYVDGRLLDDLPSITLFTLHYYGGRIEYPMFKGAPITDFSVRSETTTQLAHPPASRYLDPRVLRSMPKLNKMVLISQRDFTLDAVLLGQTPQLTYLGLRGMLQLADVWMQDPTLLRRLFNLETLELAYSGTKHITRAHLLGLSKLQRLIIYSFDANNGTVRTWERGLASLMAPTFKVTFAAPLIKSSKCVSGFHDANLNCTCAEGYHGDGTFCEARCPRPDRLSISDCINPRLRALVPLGLAAPDEDDLLYWGSRCQIQCLSLSVATPEARILECGIDGQWMGLKCPASSFTPCPPLRPEADVICERGNLVLKLEPGSRQLIQSLDSQPVCSLSCSGTRVAQLVCFRASWYHAESGREYNRQEGSCSEILLSRSDRDTTALVAGSVAGVAAVIVLLLWWRLSTSSSRAVAQYEQEMAAVELQQTNQLLAALKMQGLQTDKLIDRSRLERVKDLGEGNFGTVYLAAYNGPDGTQEVAVKEGRDNDADARVQILKEIQIMAKLQHPCIIGLVGAIPDGNTPALVLEYAANGDLRSYVLERRRTAEPTMVTLYGWAEQLADALAYLSKQSIVHRDIAARNVLVMRDATKVKLSDVGLSRLHDEGNYYKQTSSDAMPLRWLSPEAVVHRKYSSASDVWAYGILLWELATWGKVPYGESSSAETAKRIMHGHLPAIPPDCPSQLAKLVQACWRHEPGQRANFDWLRLQAKACKDACLQAAPAQAWVTPNDYQYDTFSELDDEVRL